MELLDQYVEQTLKENIVPIELKFQPVYENYNAGYVAYRGTAYINSLVYGVLTPADYADTADMAKQGVELAFACLVKAMRLVNRFVYAGRENVEWVSVQCPTGFLLEENLYERLKAVIEQQEFRNPKMICFEFSEDVLKLRSQRADTCLSDLKALGFRTAIRNCGTGDFSLADLLTFTPDIVFMDEGFINLINDRDKSNAVPALIRYVRSLGISVVAEGVKDDDMLRELNRSDCRAFIPSASYSGKFSCKLKLIDGNTAMTHKED